MKLKSDSNNTAGAVAQERLVRLSAGDVIQRGDKFLSGDGRYLKMDNLGRLLGVRCLGQTLKKEGAWFREPNAKVSHGDRERQPDTHSTHKQP